MNKEALINQNLIYDTVVIGAGAAGLFYAANDTSNGKKLILEKTKKPGLKLLMSGGGMCNITHAGSIKDFITHYGDKGGKIRSCLYKYNNLHLMDFFQSGGVPLIEREDGKVFPRSLKARDILDLLLDKAKRNGFELCTDAQVTAIDYAASDSDNCSDNCADKVSSDNYVRITINHKVEISTKKLVVATGGASYPTTGSDGNFNKVLQDNLQLKMVSLRPALAPIFVENYSYGELSGISS